MFIKKAKFDKLVNDYETMIHDLRGVIDSKQTVKDEQKEIVIDVCNTLINDGGELSIKNNKLKDFVKYFYSKSMASVNEDTNIKKLPNDIDDSVFIHVCGLLLTATALDSWLSENGLTIRKK